MFYLYASLIRNERIIGGSGDGGGLRRKFQPWRENETVLVEIR